MQIAGSQLIKHLRLRLQDIYKPDGQLITNFLTDDGTSWLADELKGILVNAYVQYHKYRKLVYPHNYFISMKVSVSNNFIPKSSFIQPFSKVISIRKDGIADASAIYTEISVEDYYSRLVNLSSVRNNQNMFVVLSDGIVLIGDTATEVWVLYETYYDNQINFNGNIEVYNDLDIILDLAELECRRIEGSIEYTKLIVDMLNSKLSLFFAQEKLLSKLGLNKSQENRDAILSNI